MSIRTPVIAGAVVTPYRFTTHPRELVAFLELLGMRTFLRQDEFAVLTGRSGRVAVHPLASARTAHEATTLVLGVPDAVAAAEALTGAGVDATWWDESWGRQASVPGPVGVLTLDAETADAYGYDVAETPAPHGSGVDVVATIYTSEPDEVAAYFALFGFHPGPDASPDWVPLRAGGRSGVVGLFPTPHAAPADGPVPTEIGIETVESLETLAARLRDAGHPVAVVDDAGAHHLVVTDPDGIALEVNAAS
jgi:hypothetical protein